MSLSICSFCVFASNAVGFNSQGYLAKKNKREFVSGDFTSAGKYLKKKIYFVPGSLLLYLLQVGKHCILLT